MLRIFSLFLIYSFVFSYASSSGDPYKNIEYYKLENGLQVYLLSDNKVVNTHISAKFRVGFDIENNSTYGLSHMVEHMVFRDQRVPHHDYLDYIKEEGGTYINGYTTRYETEYLATIDSNKSYWIASTFATMLFDKNITNEDIEVERGALQTEIGEAEWYDKLFWKVRKFFEYITPPDENFYRDEFTLSQVHDLPALYHAQENNNRFPLDEIMQHYEKYYYPANMTLTIVGNFSIEKMKLLIAQKYGSLKQNGESYTKKPSKDAKLNHKPYNRFYEGVGKNSAYIGSKYIIDDYKKYLILDIYTNNLARRLQQYMRNKLGKTYSVNPYNFNNRNAAVVSINFDSLNEDFEANIRRVQEEITKDREDLNESTITNALRTYEQEHYSSIEHDSDSLIALVDTVRYLREEHNITKSSSYDIFKSITNQEFRATIKEVFTPENSYRLIYRDYYFFPLELPLLSLLSIILFIFVYIKVYRIGVKKEQMAYTHRDVVMQRRVSNRFVGFLILFTTMIVTSILLEWIQYLLFYAFMGNPYYIFTINVPYSYLATILDTLSYLILFVILYIALWRYYARMELTNDTIYIIGNRVLILKRSDIVDISIAPWSIKLYRDIIGSSLLFWKPLVQVKLKDGSSRYLRASNATHLAEDLEKWRMTS